MRVGVFGATGMVGREIVRVLADRHFRMDDLRVYASERSVGKAIRLVDGEVVVEDQAGEAAAAMSPIEMLEGPGIRLSSADNADYRSLDIAFFAIGKNWPRENAPKAARTGCTVIDNSSTFRYDDNIPLVIPGINPDAIGKSRLIANPNCTTAIAALPLWQLYTHCGLKRVLISTYQATSGAGKAAMEELERETRSVLAGNAAQHKAFVHPIPFNIIPHIDAFQENGYTREEMKVVWETRKIFGDSRLQIGCTCVRIPTYRAHAESIFAETEVPITRSRALELFSSAKGVVVRDDPANKVYPMPLTATRQYDVEVGRVRQSLVFGSHGIDFFVCGDQLLRGAALNAVEIGELVAARHYGARMGR